MNEVTITVEMDTALMMLWILQTRGDVYNDYHRLKERRAGKNL